MVVPEDVVEEGVGVPPIPGELRPGPLAGRVRVAQWTVERDRAGRRVGRDDGGGLDGRGAEADADGHPGAVAGEHPGDPDLGRPRPGGRRQRGVVDRVGPDGVLEVVAGRRAVRALRVELHVVDVHLHLGEAAEGQLVLLLRGERDVDAVAHVGADGERLRPAPTGQQVGLVLGEGEQQPGRVAPASRDRDR
jgi:hypothetical protein